MKILKINTALVIFILFITQFAYGQKDTVNIALFKIVENKLPKPYKATSFDSTEIENATNLAQLISENSTVFIKTYGAGSLASISFRGTGASHTQVLWNGVSLNSPMNGQIDFSLYPTIFFDEAELHHGASGLIDGSGALGGSVILNNKEEYNLKRKITFKQAVGSFNSYTSAVRIKTGNTKWFYETQLYSKNSKNNFEYTNITLSENPTEELTNAKNAQYGFQQAVYRKLKAGSIGARVWYFNSDRQLPGAITSTTKNNETQQDESVRALIELKGLKDKLQYHFSTAFINNQLIYENENANIYSLNKSYLSDNNINTDIYLNNNFKLKNNLNIRYEHANADGYIETNSRIKTSWLLGLSKQFKKLSINGFNRIIIIDFELKPFAPGFGIQYSPFNKEQLMFKLNSGINYHQPTFNDLYWNPGGNPNLKPEEAKMLEGGISYSKRIKKTTLNTEITTFYSRVNNWIIWLPTEFGFWSPTNLKEVENKGIETSLSVLTQVNKLKLTTKLNYAYTKSINLKAKNELDNSLNKQLIYVPYHKVNSSLKLNFKSINLTYTSNYTGIRFTTTDNNWYLPANFISDISLSNRFKINEKWNINTSFKVLNILNQEFQSIAWRPMPGRNYLFTLTLNIND